MASPALPSLPFTEVERLSARLAVAPATILGLIGVTQRTAARRKSEGRLRKDEADRLLRVNRIFKEAVRVFGTEKKAALWLNRPHPMFSDATPLSVLDTDAGAHAVSQELIRIDFGDFA